jgi:WD40 repeat protein
MPTTNLNRTISEAESNITGVGDQQISVVLTRVVEQVFRLTRAQGAAIALRDPEGVLCQASIGLAPAVGSRLPPDSGFTRECFETGRVVLCEDAENDPRIRPLIARSLRLRSALAVPILAQDSVLGVMLMFSSRPFAFDATHVTAVQRIAQSLVSISARGSAEGDQLVTGDWPHVPAPTQARSLTEERPAARSSLVLAHPERSIDSQLPPARVEDGKRASSVVSSDIFERPDRKPTAARAWLAVGSILALLLLLFFFGLPHRRSTKIPSGNTPAASSASSKVEEDGAKEANSSRVGSSQMRAAPAEQSGSLASSLPHPDARLAADQPDSKTPKMDGRVTVVISPPPPALVIEGAPAGAQIFVDDQLTASIGSNGQAKISTVAPGQHRLHLKFNGYGDYEQSVNLRPGQTSTVAAKLEPLEPPALTAPTKAPLLAVTPAIPPPVRSLSTSRPDFVLDRTLKGHSAWVTAVAFSVDGQRLASGSWDRSVKLWNVPTGQELTTVGSKGKEVEAVAFSRNGQWLATENSANMATLWDATTGAEIRTFPGNKPVGVLGSNWVYSIAFSPDGRWLASGVDDKTVRLWDVQTGRTVRDLVGLRRSVIYVAFSPDGHWLATGADDKTIVIWDVSTGQEIRRLTGHKRPIYAVAFSPNGRWLASASGDKTVRLWDVVTGREVRTLIGHRDLVTSLAFSPDGRWLASGSWDNTIRIWDVVTGHEGQTLEGHNHHIYTVAFDSQGRWLASGSEDGTIKLWRWADGIDQSGLR